MMASSKLPGRVAIVAAILFAIHTLGGFPWSPFAGFSLGWRIALAPVMGGCGALFGGWAGLIADDLRGKR